MAFNFSQTKKEFLSAIVFAFLSFSLFSADAKFSGAVTGEMGMPFPYALGSGDFSTAIVRFDGNLYLYATDSLTFYASGSALLDAMAYQTDSYDLAGKDGMFGLSLNEAWVDYSTDYWAVRIGRQINAWGTADGIAVTDILCPKNYTSIDSMLSTDSRLGIDAARVSAKFDKFAFDFYWIPFVRTIALPTSASHPLTKDFANDNDLALRLAKSRKVDISAENFEYALKASAYWKYADVSLYAFYGWDRFPSEFNLYTKEDGKAVYFEGIHKRILMFGADASIPIGDLMLRLECALFPYNAITAPFTPIDEILSADVIPSDRNNKMTFLSGVDWMPGGWILSAQYYGDIVFGEMAKITRDRYIHLATLAVSKTFFGDTLSLSLAGLLQLGAWNNAFMFLAAYSVTDSFTVYSKFTFLHYVQEVLLDDYKNWGAATIGARYAF